MNERARDVTVKTFTKLTKGSDGKYSFSGEVTQKELTTPLLGSAQVVDLKSGGSAVAYRDQGQLWYCYW